MGVSERPVLVAPAAFDGLLRAPQVAAALGRGIERAGLMPPDLCPVADGGAGTLEVLLTALGGDTAGIRVGDVAAGFALLEGGGTALVEPHAEPEVTEALLGAAAASGAAVVLVAAVGATDGPRRLGTGRPGVVALCDLRAPSPLALSLRDAGAVLEAAVPFILDALELDSRMRAARCVIVGEGVLHTGTLNRGATGEVATRARQAGVPAHAVTIRNRMDAFAARIADLQCVLEAGSLEELEVAGEQLGTALREGRI